jgi:hypothetical protein
MFTFAKRAIKSTGTRSISQWSLSFFCKLAGSAAGKDATVKIKEVGLTGVQDKNSLASCITDLQWRKSFNEAA